jgi:hypothetical protein
MEPQSPPADGDTSAYITGGQAFLSNMGAYPLRRSAFRFEASRLLTLRVAD